MLAKIAHSFAVAEMGLGSFKPLLPDLILGKTMTPTYWVGGQLDIPPPGVTDRIDLDYDWNANGKTFTVAHIRLFAQLGAPLYHVVIGER
jgi:hypothetical protein